MILAASQAIVVSYTDLAIAGVMVFLVGLASVAFKLGLEKSLALAAARTVTQLLLIGFVLRWVFAQSTPWVLWPVMLVMIAAAARAAIKRSSRSYRGAGGLAFLTLVISGLLATFTVTGAILRVEPWYQARYVIPLLGMVLGNTLTGISLCLDEALTGFAAGRAEVETELSLGATRWEAARRPLRRAVRRGMVPIINSMMVVGLVSLPGMMTGQILAGANPLQAVQYQIIVMFMIAAGTSVGCILIAMLTFRRVFTPNHRLRIEIIQKRNS